MKKQIESVLYKALLLDGKMEHRLYEYELEEHITYWKKGLKKDNEDFVFVVSERDGDVAMLLITDNDELYINEKAREKLKTLWIKAYKTNIEKMLPYIAEELGNGILSVNGVKFTD